MTDAYWIPVASPRWRVAGGMPETGTGGGTEREADDSEAPLRIGVARRRHIVVLTIVGLMDHSTSGDLHGALKELERRTPPRWVADLSGVTHLSSGGFNVLIGFTRRHRLAGGDLKLAGLTGRVRHLIEAVGADRILRIFQTPTEACADFFKPLPLYFRVDQDFAARRGRGPVHATTCEKIRNSRIGRLEVFASLSDALKAGRRPCGACLGPRGEVGP